MAPRREPPQIAGIADPGRAGAPGQKPGGGHRLCLLDTLDDNDFHATGAGHFDAPFGQPT